MLKKLLIIFALLLFPIANVPVFADPPVDLSKEQWVNCEGLPGCDKGGGVDNGENPFLTFLVSVISEFMQIVAVVALFALIFSGVMYLISSGDEEKIKKAQKWIIYSLIGVFISVSAWGIINLINDFRIG